MGGVSPPGSPISLEPPTEPTEGGLLKQERGTLIWRTRGPEGERWVVKLYRRRGFLAALRSHLTRFRSEREYRRLAHLQRSGVRCTAPVGWAHGRRSGHGFYDMLVMEEVPGAVQLGEYLRREGDAASLEPLFRLARRMHESGFCHQTLYARNILVSQGGPPEARYYMSDVPRSWTFPRSIVGTAMAWFDLLDLTHSIVEAGIAPEEVPVEAYGPPSAGHRWSGGRDLARLRTTRDARSKWSRFWRDVSTRLRWAVAWTLWPLTRSRT